MSEIRKIVAKVLKESNFSLNEKLEVQPDMFGGKDTYYKDGKQAVDPIDVLNFIQQIVPDLTDMKNNEKKRGFYWMNFKPAHSGIKIDSKFVTDLESKLANTFGEGVVRVKLKNSKDDPEIKNISLGFLNKNDFEESTDDSDMETTSDGKFKIGDFVIKGLNLGKIKRIYNVYGNDRIVLDTLSTYDAIEDPRGYKLITPEKIQEFLSNPSLQEGWKDNLKKGVATLGVAGALAGNAMAHDPMYDGAQRPFDNPYMTVEKAQWLADEDEKAVRLPNGMIKDQYGNEWTQEDWETLMRGEDPSDELDFPPEYADQIED